MRRSYIPIDGMASNPDAMAVIGYPTATPRQKAARMRELDGLGIDSVSFSGPTTIGKTSILGKGYVGIVILARETASRRLFAVKIRRTDSPRPHMKHEGVLLKASNQAGVGPKLHRYSRNFLVMEYAKGVKIGDWLDGLNGRGTAARLRGVIKSIITDCFRLDEAGIDHGEISKITKHVIVSADDHPVIIDFESASVDRRPSNVTSITQAIFISSAIAKKVQRVYGSKMPTKEVIISNLREYKRKPGRDTLDELVATLKLV